TATSNCSVNSTNPGIIIRKYQPCKNYTIEQDHREFFLSNNHACKVAVLLIVLQYSYKDPIPGGVHDLDPSKRQMAHPYLVLTPNILTTQVQFSIATVRKENLSDADIVYDIYLSYMYEGDMTERDYWKLLIDISTMEGLKKRARKVKSHSPNFTNIALHDYFVSYSGVGAVITVATHVNGSHFALYTAAVSYGCDFIAGEEYQCTKLINPLAKLFCASLLFLGTILLVFGHRWLNYTMFIAGFFGGWCFLFVLFSQIPDAKIDGLGWGTLFGALICGVSWLMIWHRFKRPFYSALLIIILNSFFVAMVFIHFLKYGIVPTYYNMAAFVIFPVLFAILIIAYSIRNIKLIHIFSCTFLGSFITIVPFSFYFGATLMYIVINVIGAITVNHYSGAIGYPPFQTWDIILLCVWILLFAGGMFYQLYKEHSSPPFHPPSLASWNATKKALTFVWSQIISLLYGDADTPDNDQCSMRSIITRTTTRIMNCLTCRKRRDSESGYESLPRQHSSAQEDLPNLGDDHPSSTAFDNFKEKAQSWIKKFQTGIMKKDNVESSSQPDTVADQERLLDEDPSGSSTAFGKTQVILHDSYVDDSIT
ncbi:unnamed protein product, partial [Meganyctiphanes norvegica]